MLRSEYQSFMRFVTVAERILITLWIGGLWVIGYMAVPMLFATLDDRKLAGSIAGDFFHVMNYIGLVCGALLLVSVVVRMRKTWQVWALIAMLALVCVNEFTVQPLIQELKLLGIAEGSPAQAEFKRLHGLASVLYMITSLLGLSLVIFGLQKNSDL